MAMHLWVRASHTGAECFLFPHRLYVSTVSSMKQLQPVMSATIEVVGALSVVQPAHILASGDIGDIGLFSCTMQEKKLSIIDILAWVMNFLYFIA